MSIFIKWLLVAVVIGVGYHWWRRNRTDTSSSAEHGEPVKPVTIVKKMGTCRYCGLHTDAQEMVQGNRGMYCSAEHRSAQPDESN